MYEVSTRTLKQACRRQTIQRSQRLVKLYMAWPRRSISDERKSSLSKWMEDQRVVTAESCCLTPNGNHVIIHTMNASQSNAPISDLLRRTIAESGISYNALQRETGVTRASIMRFVRGDQSIRLDMADRLAAYLNLELR
jgi:hypothetical protein